MEQNVLALLGDLYGQLAAAAEENRRLREQVAQLSETPPPAH